MPGSGAIRSAWRALGCSALLLACCLAARSQELPRIVEIRFEGLRNIPEHTVRSVLTLQVGEAYSVEKAQQNINAVGALGFFADAKLDPRPVEGGIALVFILVENPVIKEVRFEGNTAVPSEVLLNELIANRPERVFNAQRIQRDQEALADYYRAQGYLLADVAYEFDPQRGLLVFRLAEYHIERIEVTGNRKTRSHAILRWLYSKPGDLWSPRTFSERDLRELMNLGIFEGPPEVKADLGSEPDKVVLTLEVKERDTGILNGGAGYSSRYGLLGFAELGEDNFLGRVEQIRTRIEFGGRQSYELDFFDPWLDSHRTTLRVSLYDTTADRFTNSLSGSALGSSVGSFRRRTLTEERRGGELTLGRPLSIDDRIQIGVKSETVSTERLLSSQVPSLPSLPFLALSGDTTRSLVLGLIRDRRDYFLDPRRGHRLSLNVEFAGQLLGGDNRFAKYLLEARKYLALGSKTTLAGRAQLGLSNGRVPFSQVYFVGGSETLRSYEEDRFFGNQMLLVNLELRRRVTENLQAVLFLDSGRAWRQKESTNLLSDLVVGFGVGMRVQTPLAPLRLDYGIGKEGTRFHFGFGQLF